MTTAIGKRIAQIRGNQSQAAFAKETGIHKNTLGGYERAERTPDADFIQKLMQAGYNANWVISGDGPMLIKDLQSPENNQENKDLENVSLSDEELAKYKEATEEIFKLSPDDDVTVWIALVMELSMAYAINEGAIRRLVETIHLLNSRNK